MLVLSYFLHALKHQVGVFDCRWCRMISMTSSLHCRALCSASAQLPWEEQGCPGMSSVSSFPSASSRILHLCRELHYRPDPASQEPPWHRCPYLFRWVTFTEQFLPVMPAPRNVQAAVYSRSGAPFLEGVGKVLPWLPVSAQWRSFEEQ